MDAKTLREQELLLVSKFAQAKLNSAMEEEIHNHNELQANQDDDDDDDEDDQRFRPLSEKLAEIQEDHRVGLPKVDPFAVQLARALNYVNVPEYATVLPHYAGLYTSRICMTALLDRFATIVRGSDCKNLAKMPAIEAATDYIFNQGKLSPLNLNAGIVGIVALAREIPEFLNLVHLDGVMAGITRIHEALDLPSPSAGPTNTASWAVVQKEGQPIGCFTFVLVLPYGVVTIESNVPYEDFTEPALSNRVVRVPFGSRLMGERTEASCALATMLLSLYDHYMEGRIASGDLEVKAWLTSEEIGELANSLEGSLSVVDDSSSSSIVGVTPDQGLVDLRVAALGSYQSTISTRANDIALLYNDVSPQARSVETLDSMLVNSDILEPNTFGPNGSSVLSKAINTLDCATGETGHRASPYSPLELILGPMARLVMSITPTLTAHIRSLYSTGELILSEILYYYMSGRWAYEELLARNRHAVIKSQTPIRVRNRSTLSAKFPEYQDMQDAGIELGVTYKLMSPKSQSTLITFIASCPKAKAIGLEDNLEDITIHAYIVGAESVAKELLGRLQDPVKVLSNLATTELHGHKAVRLVSVKTGLSAIRRSIHVSPAAIQLGSRLLFGAGNLRLTDVDINSCLSGTLHLVSESDIMMTKGTMISKLDKENAVIMTSSAVLDDATMDKFNAQAVEAFHSSHSLRRQIAVYSRHALRDLIAMSGTLSALNFKRISRLYIRNFDFLANLKIFEPLALEPVVLAKGRFKTMTGCPLRTNRLADIAKEAAELELTTESQAINALKTIIRVNAFTPMDTPSLADEDPTLPYEIAFTKRLGGAMNYLDKMQDIATTLTCLSREVALRTANHQLEELVVPFQVLPSELMNIDGMMEHVAGTMGYIRKGIVPNTSRLGNPERSTGRWVLGLDLRRE